MWGECVSMDEVSVSAEEVSECVWGECVSVEEVSVSA